MVQKIDTNKDNKEEKILKLLSLFCGLSSEGKDKILEQAEIMYQEVLNTSQ